MDSVNGYLKQLAKVEDGPHIGALFDFDGTIIAGYSAKAVLQEKLKSGRMGAEEIVETLNVMAQYSLGGLSFSGLMSSAARFMKDLSEESFREFGEALYAKHLARLVYPEARAIIQAHRAKGHTVAIVSSATIYQIEPTARDLDIAHVLCSAYELKNGVFTGEVIHPLCFGHGKVLAARRLADEHGVDLDRSFFYTDSSDDLELLEQVGNPQVLNPNKKLRGIARDRGWPVQDFRGRGRPTVMDYARTVAATSSLVGSFVAGLPILALTGSRREAVNFSLGMFGDIASALVGIELEVHGEEHLWGARPCVFIFNHQSKADLVIVAKLVRKDVGGVGKKEVRSMPLIGRVLEFAGTVFVDRQNTESAIRTMQPLVDAIRKERRSICLAPEGTRTLSQKLAPFKKGAFHLALQAGVPLVPIVIHNAGDVAPKNDFAMRAAKVRVDVLPPVDTAGWRTATLDAHVAEVRGMFLEALGQSGGEDEGALAARPKAAKKVKAAARPRAKAAVKAPAKVSGPSRAKAPRRAKP